MDPESSTKFIGSLTKFLQSLCNGYVEFEDGVELIGHIYLSVDTGKRGRKIDYILNEKVCKSDNSVTFISNSFHAQPDSKGKAASGKEGDSKKDDGETSDSDSVVKSTNVGTLPHRTSQGSRSLPSPNQQRSSVQAGTKRPGSPLKAPTPPQRRAPTPPSQRRMQSSAAKGPSGSPASKTVPSSPSSSSQDNIPSPSPLRKRSETSQPPSNQSENAGADNDTDHLMPPNIVPINPTPDLASFLGSLTGDNHSSRDQRSPLRDTKPDTDVTFIKEEFMSEPSSCAQAGSSGQHSGRSGDDGSGLYPVMLHQNTSVFPSTSAGYPPGGFSGGASATATSQQPAFPGSSTSSDLFNPVPGTSQDGTDPSDDDDVQAVMVTSTDDPEVCFYVTTTLAATQQQQGHESPKDIEFYVSDVDSIPDGSLIDASIHNSPVVYSRAPTLHTLSNAQHDDPTYGIDSDNFAYQQQSSAFSTPQPHATGFEGRAVIPDPVSDTVDYKYDVSYLLSLSQQKEGVFRAASGRRGAGRPRKSSSLVSHFGTRHVVHRDGTPQASSSSTVFPGFTRQRSADGKFKRKGPGRPRKHQGAASSQRGRGVSILRSVLVGNYGDHTAGMSRGENASQTPGTSVAVRGGLSVRSPRPHSQQRTRAAILSARAKRRARRRTLQSSPGQEESQTRVAARESDTGDLRHTSLAESGSSKTSGEDTEGSAIKKTRGLPSHPCDKCGKRYLYIGSLEKHRQRCRGDKEKDNEICRNCGKRFIYSKALETHKVHCGRTSRTEDQDNEDDDEDEMDDTEDNEICRNCGKRFIYPKALKTHKVHCGRTSRTEDKDDDEEEGEVEAGDNGEEDDNDEEATGTGVTCSKCGRCFNEELRMKSHWNHCTQSYFFKCSLCKEGFFRSELFAQHVVTTHGVDAKDAMSLRQTYCY
ncbi:uncharacterized protein [Littorina saxatilis]|uniref:uncharacterized protein isoform X1 n=1 Tax=Littorina saxatilis TaxID=31220 RepID=UPI0038B5BB80